ncbi:MAG TPA: hypothetical protein VN578_01520 [Candidatus Binatia bacterium]|nr:hypothetical protein [Candidatus Binatia bacterium]
MKLFSLLLPLVFAARVAGAEVKTASFKEGNSEVRWNLKDLNPELPSDWSAYSYLTMELRASTAQRFELRVFTTNGLRHVGLLPFQGAWIRAAVPLAYFQRPDRQGFDLASLGNKSRASYWLNLMGGYGPVDSVEAIGFAMRDPLGAPTIEIRSVRLDKESPGDAVLEPKPLVDEFGQWIHNDWPGKAKSLEDLKRAWAEEDKSLKPGPFDSCQYGGYKSTKAKAPGFFESRKSTTAGGLWTRMGTCSFRPARTPRPPGWERGQRAVTTCLPRSRRGTCARPPIAPTRGRSPLSTPGTSPGDSARTTRRRGWT